MSTLIAGVALGLAIAALVIAMFRKSPSIDVHVHEDGAAACKFKVWLCSKETLEKAVNFSIPFAMVPWEPPQAVIKQMTKRLEGEGAQIVTVILTENNS